MRRVRHARVRLRVMSQSGEDGGVGGGRPHGSQSLRVRPVGVPLTGVISWEASYMVIEVQSV